MSVNPGFAGQDYLDFVTPKFKKLVEQAKKYGGYKVCLLYTSHKPTYQQQ